MKPNTKKLIAALIIVLALAAAFLIQNGAVSKYSAATPTKDDAYSADEASTTPFSGRIATAESPSLSQEISGQENHPQKESPKTTAPVSPAQTAVPEKKAATCALTISCKTILDNMDKLTVGKETIVPADGCIMSLTDVQFAEGDTVFDVLKRELKARNIHFEFSVSPAYNTVYIEGICNLYELDCGELSGWMYTVNGAFPSVGCKDYKLSDGDSIALLYTCDLGRDVGGGEQQ